MVASTAHIVASTADRHTGSGIKDQARNIAANQALLRGLFAGGYALLAEGGELHLTLKRGEPYDSWNAVVLGKLAGLRVKHCTAFVAQRFPGYAHRRTIGDVHAGADEVVTGKTYVFVPKSSGEEEEATGGIGGGKGGGKGSGKGGGKQGGKQGGKMLQTGQSYKEAWKQRHSKGKR